MSQLNFYVPDEIEEQIRVAAKKEGKTLSAFIAELVKRHFPENHAQENYFSQFFGAWEGDLTEVERPLPQKRDEL
jgi:hypothetical protein